jgi:hypothetical protein
MKTPLIIRTAETNNPKDAALFDARSVLRLAQTIAMKIPLNIAMKCGGNSANISSILCDETPFFYGMPMVCAGVKPQLSL